MPESFLQSLVGAVVAPAGVAALVTQSLSARNQKASLINSTRLNAYGEIYGCLASVQQHCADLRRYLVGLDPSDPYALDLMSLERRLQDLFDNNLRAGYQRSVTKINSLIIFVTPSIEASIIEYLSNVKDFADFINSCVLEARDAESGALVGNISSLHASGLSTETNRVIGDRYSGLEKLIGCLGRKMRKEINVGSVEFRLPEVWPDARDESQQSAAYPHISRLGND